MSDDVAELDGLSDEELQRLVERGFRAQQAITRRQLQHAAELAIDKILAENPYGPNKLRENELKEAGERPV
jgi:hypothetical protein